MTSRTGTKGVYRRQIKVIPIWTWDGVSARAVAETAIISQNLDGTRQKYSLSNTPVEALSLSTWAYRQGQRYWVERSIQDIKEAVRMDECQLRTWQGWQHHLALCLMASAFMLKQRLEHQDAIPLLSCTDIRDILQVFLLRKVKTKADLVAIIQQRHKQRQRDIDRHLKSDIAIS